MVVKKTENPVNKIQLEDLGKVKYFIILIFLIFSLVYVYLYQPGLNGESSILLVVATLF